MPSFESKYEKLLLELKLNLKSYIQSVREAANMPADVPSDKVFLKYDDSGFPILVGFNPTKPLPKTQVENLIREYLSRHYCMFLHFIGMPSESNNCIILAGSPCSW